MAKLRKDLMEKDKEEDAKLKAQLEEARKLRDFQMEYFFACNTSASM